ncbi:MAG: 50S ribosomal protein L22 [Candidatus Levybacteria bacterium RIFCSPLOWO2_01_FULL_36_13]|nr:MAG: 50S ribosomal protein L22 [Candidatus Levybacteria bacterium RIFCSPHIGHO2_01_FULL_36_15b]OGH35018.1 MAG: 50S ribosomal protein L22 [Candidatus Levybacteria bacterium RIFCSPLOWO2_01_FULL_36_13]
MEIIAVSKSVRVAPRKVRLVADSVRKMPIEDALATLGLINKRGAVAISKTLKSAISNAKNNNKLEKDMLIIKSIEVAEAPFYKRFRPSTRGRVHPYKRRGSHIKIILSEKNVQLGAKSKTVTVRQEKEKKEEKSGTKS